jgi:outer membrane lipoprotein-sorting protein
MRKYATIFAIVVLVLFTFTGTLLAIDADEIVRKNLEAKGGIDKLKAMKTLYMKGKYTAENMVGQIELAKKAPNLLSFTVTTPMGKMTQGCDGEKMWATNPRTGFRMLDGEDFKKGQDQTLMEPLLGFKERGGAYEYVGIGDVNGDSCYKMLFVQNSGDSTYSYFDIHTFQMVKTEANTPRGLAEQFFEDFREIDGFVFPFSVKVGTTMGERKIEYDTIAVNQPVSDSFFVMPDPKSVPSIAKPLPDSARGKPLQRR